MGIKGETGFKRLFKKVLEKVSFCKFGRGFGPEGDRTPRPNYSTSALCNNSVEPFGRMVDRIADRIPSFSPALFRSPDSVMAGPNCATELLQKFRVAAPKREIRLSSHVFHSILTILLPIHPFQPRSNHTRAFKQHL